MALVTLETLISSIRLLGDFENSTTFTDAFVTEHVNQAIEDYYEAVLDSNADYYLKQDETLVTVAGTAEVSLPSDFQRLRKLERKLGTDQYTPIRATTLIDGGRFNGRGAPRAYAMTGQVGTGSQGKIRLFPTPDGVYTLRATYNPVAPTLAAGQSINLLPKGREVVVYGAVLKLDEREGRDIRNRQFKLDRAMEALKASLKRRDDAEPEYLFPVGGARWDEDD